MTITEQAAYVHGITERRARGADNHEQAVDARYHDTVRLLMQLKGPVQTMRMLNDSIAQLARVLRANQEDN